jgi:signal transduction histidine kinase/CheY-like chemotaxis protein/HPt (histidine-containing phosphotransfer) domain-containing protein
MKNKKKYFTMRNTNLIKRVLREEKNSRSSMTGWFIGFSAMFFLLIFAAGSIAFIFSKRQIIKASQKDEMSNIMEVKQIRLDNLTNIELVIVRKLADSPLIKRYFTNPDNEELRKLALEEVAGYRRAFLSHFIFWINDIDKMFHTDDHEPFLINPEDSVNYWYNMTLYETEVFNFNINYNPDMDEVKLWINAPVFDVEGNPLGMVGTGIALTDYIKLMYQDIREDIKLYLFNARGEITCSRDIQSVIAKNKLGEVLSDIAEDIFAVAKELEPGKTLIFDAFSQNIAVRKLSSLDWYAVAIMPDRIEISDFNNSMSILFLIVLAIMFLVFVVFNLFIARFDRSLCEAMRIVKDASKAKSDFLANMSHEIRTPMNAIIGIAQIQLQKRNLPGVYEEAFDKIYRSGSSLLGIINDILDISKIETGKLELSLAEYDVPSFINDTVQVNVLRIGSKEIDFVVDPDSTLPSRLYGDELRLKQILNNLLSNAIKYTDRGQVKLSISHSMAVGEDVLLRFSVEDTGQGFMPEDKAKLFSEYQRFNASANRTTEGTGLGLFITKRLVDMMDGKIEVESVYGKGSVFTVEVFQRNVPCKAIGSDVAENLKKFTFSVNTKDKSHCVRDIMPYGKILVVDDVDTNLYVAQGLLAPYQLNVETANSGFAAIALVESGKTYDIIFMDHMMPLMDGIEAVQKIRLLGYKGIIVALTANALIGAAEMFKQNDFDGFVSKPIDIRQLNATLNKFVRDRHPEEAKKYKPEEIITKTQKLLSNPKILSAFRSDAQKAVVTLRETIKNKDVKLFTIVAHGMKSALANIGESEKAKLASALEQAGLNGDIGYMKANTEGFIQVLEELIKAISKNEETVIEDDTEISEDRAYLTEQLEAIKSACENFDNVNVYRILDRLKEKALKKETVKTLEKIREVVYVFSDFEEAVTIIRKFLEKYKG